MRSKRTAGASRCCPPGSGWIEHEFRSSKSEDRRKSEARGPKAAHSAVAASALFLAWVGPEFRPSDFGDSDFGFQVESNAPTSATMSAPPSARRCERLAPRKPSNGCCNFLDGKAVRQFPRYSDEQRKIIPLAAWRTTLDAEAAAENWRLDWLLERNQRRLGRWNRRMVMEQSPFIPPCRESAT